MEDVKEEIAKKITEGQRVVDALLQTGEPFIIKVAEQNWTILHKVFPKKRQRKFMLYPICFGALFKISKVIEEMEILDLLEQENDQALFQVALDSIAKDHDKVVKIIAHAILNNDKKPSRGLLRFLSLNLNTSGILKIMTGILKMMDIKHFLAFMVSIKGMNLMEAGQISGKSSEESKNISDIPEKKSSGSTVG